ncbi:MAG: HAD hydrolase-like protein [Patescibacteria group bacterium]
MKKLVIFDFDGVFIDTLDIKTLQTLKGLLKSLCDRYILAIISSTSNSTIKKILEKEKVLPYFEDILGFENYTSKVVRIKMLLEKYKVAPKDAVYITDTLGDILGGNECQINSVGVTWGFNDRKTLEKGNPAVIIDDPRDLIAVVDSVLK